MKSNKLKEEIKRREYFNEMAPFPVFDTEIIQDMSKLSEIVKKQDYNNEPICYCKTCLSINIKTVEFEPVALVNGKSTSRNVDYCVPCSNTEMGEVHISEWQDMYKERYGEDFLTLKK